MSRQELSRANQLFYGRASIGNYQTGKPGHEVSMLYRFKPAGNRAITFTAGLAAGAASGTLSAVWNGATGIWPITFSDGETMNAVLANGATTCTFLPGSFPQATGSTGPFGGTGALVNAVTAAATVGGQPPVLAVSNFYVVSASIGAAGAAVLAATVPDVPRNVVGAWTTASTVTVVGTDYYGYPQTETQTGVAFTGKKGFASITSITSSAAITLATFGTGSALGLPFNTNLGDIMAPALGGAADASTLVTADATYPATTSTGDVRGTVTTAGALNGSSFYSALLKPRDPTTQFGLFGVPPV